MNKDQVAGKLKDVAGRVERQTGEWTGDTEKQAHGAMRQAEGKVQNAWGNVKDAGEKAVNKNATREKDPVVVDDDVEKENEDMASRRKAS
ncbi:MAG: CsbD family protein [Candidatus Sulfotelmatobacter sp.]